MHRRHRLPLAAGLLLAASVAFLALAQQHEQEQEVVVAVGDVLEASC
jgi:hypothetical protein